MSTLDVIAAVLTFENDVRTLAAAIADADARQAMEALCTSFHERLVDVVSVSIQDPWPTTRRTAWRGVRADEAKEVKPGIQPCKREADAR
jgi:hypothetical protein